jgi:hypothetical protein
MREFCADCGTREFDSCFTETFPARTHDGSALTLTLCLCLGCGQRFPDRSKLRSYLYKKLPNATRERILARA